MINLLDDSSLSHRSRSIFESRIFRLKNGWWPFTLPLGYVKTRKGGCSFVEVDEKNGKMVSFIFNTYVVGDVSVHDVRNIGLSLGYNVKGTIWQILNNKFYIGIMEYRGESYNHNYQKLVSPDIFYKCQDILKSKETPNLGMARLEASGNGIWTGRPIKGYKRVNNILVPDKDDSRYIIDIFKRFCKKNGSVWDTADFVKKKYGKVLKTGHIIRLLKSKFYGGIISYGGEETEHIHPRIITKELFNKAQALIVERGHKTRGNK